MRKNCFLRHRTGRSDIRRDLLGLADHATNATAALVALRFMARRIRDDRLHYENQECFLWEHWLSEAIDYVTGKRQSADEREEDLARRILNVHPIQLRNRSSDSVQSALGTPSYHYLVQGTFGHFCD